MLALLLCCISVLLLLMLGVCYYVLTISTAALTTMGNPTTATTTRGVDSNYTRCWRSGVNAVVVDCRYTHGTLYAATRQKPCDLWKRLSASGRRMDRGKSRSRCRRGCRPSCITGMPIIECKSTLVVCFFFCVCRVHPGWHYRTNIFARSWSTKEDAYTFLKNGWNWILFRYQEPCLSLHLYR